MEKNCIFCKIIAGQIKSDILYKDEDIIAFSDINPQPPVHILIIPKRHIEKISDLDKDSSLITSKLILVANRLAKERSLKDDGYRLVFNCGPLAGQEVYHIHLHLLGGRKFTWPPG